MQLWAGAAVTADATPAGGDDPLVAPDADAQPNGTPDVDEVLHSIRIAGAFGEDSGFWQFAIKNTPDIVGTDFADAASAACALAATLSTPTEQVVFDSDGVATTGADVTTVLPCGGVVFNTFAVGSSSSCSGDPSGLGSLQEIANLTGGTCTEVTDPTDLPDAIVPAIVQSQLTEVAVSLDQNQNGSADNAFVPLTNADIVPDLPQQGPASVDWTTTFPASTRATTRSAHVRQGVTAEAAASSSSAARSTSTRHPTAVHSSRARTACGHQTTSSAS